MYSQEISIIIKLAETGIASRENRGSFSFRKSSQHEEKSINNYQINI